jgi:hypothetical protein
MATHAKKKKINKWWVIVFTVLGLLFIASWVWLLLYFPPISNRAEGFIKNNLGKIFTAGAVDESSNAEELVDTGVNKSTDEDQVQETGNPEDEISLASEQSTKPTIRLVIDEGPSYDAEETACYYIIRAIVTGKPEPEIKFSRDDSAGSLGPGKARINLKANLRTYILTATAANDSGTAMDSITLSWGCNSPPVIGEIKVSSDIIYINEQYELSVTASDSDSESIEYKWTVAGGTLETDNQETVKWNTPSEADDYAVRVDVKDSDGNVSSRSIAVYVGTKEVTETTQPPETTPPTTTTEPSTTEPQESNFNLEKKTVEGGYLEFGGQTFSGGNLYAGDSENNKPCVGFISFDISGLGGRSVEAATLTFGGATIHGDPLSYLDAFWINIVEWGSEPITQNDFNLIGIAVQSFTAPGITCNASSLRSGLQNAINSGKSRFQIRVHFSGPYTNNDSIKDGWEYSQSGVNLNVTVR